VDKTITPQGLAELRRDKEDLLIIDVRRKSDYEADRHIIPDAVWRDPEQVEQWGKDLPMDKQIIVYCARGESVSKAVSSRLLAERVKVSYLEGGLTACKESGGDIESTRAR
jgi:rhodanese-related sulfurtransferase